MPPRSFRCLLLAVLLLAGAAARADRVVLRNGRVLEGVIESQDDQRVILRTVGTRLTLDMNRVKRVERVGEEERSALVADLLQAELPPPPFPDALKPLRAEVDRLFAEREHAVRAAANLKQALADEPRLQQERHATFSRYLELQEELHGMAGRRRGLAYRETLETTQRAAAEVHRLDLELDGIRQRQEGWRAQVSAYPGLLSAVRAHAERMREEFHEDEEDGRGTVWLRDVSARLDGLESDFASVRVPLRQNGRRTIVTARLNGRVDVNLLVDTGASVVTLTEAVAQRLGLSYDRTAPLQLMLADGSRSPGYATILNSVEVGEARLENVQAVILARPPAPDLDGLLGMSFLSAFSMTHDGTSNRLELRRFAPSGR